MSIKQYPYQNLSLDDMPGEMWKDIPGLEGYFSISNMGRVRRLAHTATTKRGPRKVKPMIITQTIVASHNAHMDDHNFYMRFAASMNNKVNNFTTGRLVYHLFVEPFDINDRDLFILYKDEDPLNVHAANLLLANQADKQRRMEARGRRGTPFLDMTPEKRKQVQEKIRKIKAQNPVNQISQYDTNGRLIRTFHNAEEAAKVIGVSGRHIAHAAVRKKVLTAAGFIWRRGSALQVDLTPVLDAPGIRRTPLAKHVPRIGQYDLEGKLIRTFPTIREASVELGYNYGRIQEAVKGRQLTYKGYIWRESIAPKIDVSHLHKAKGYRYSPLSAHERKVTQYNLDGVRIQTFPNKAEATRATGVDNKSITQAVKGEAITAGGYLWSEGTALRLDLRKFTKLPNFNHSRLDSYLRRKREANLKKLGGRGKTPKKTG